jgi:pimeloyl-ACP methyl ester carboxylesterase
LETPQPLKSVLPGEAHLYRWQRRSIFYKVLGPADAPPLVLLHRPAIGASGHEMLPVMAPLAKTYRVYALDWLGFGLSDRPGADYSAQVYGALCRDFLREVVQHPATLVGSGLSCNYAVAAAASEPDLCASLVLIAPFALLGKQRLFPLRSYAEKSPVKALLYPLLSTRVAFWLARRFGPTNREDFPQFYANTRQLGAEHAAMALLAGKLTENMEARFATLQQPVLLIWGTHALDQRQAVVYLHRIAALANPARQIRTIELIQDAALAAHREQSESTVAAIRRWQKETSQRELSTPAQATLLTLQAVDQPNASISTSPVPPAQASKPENITAAPALTDETSAIEEPADPVTYVTAPAPIGLDVGETEQATKAEKNEEPEIIAYCVKCKQKRKMLHARAVIMKNGRLAMRGVCVVCGTQLNRIGGIS